MAFTNYLFYKSAALPSDTLSVGRKLSWRYRKIVPLMTIFLLPVGRICHLAWSSRKYCSFPSQLNS